MRALTMARFTLIVCATEDGFIARYPGHAPADWASPEEQAVFRASVDAADWSVMGRGTHEAAPRPDRRRIVFSTSSPEPRWRAPTQLWLDPVAVTPQDLPALVASQRPLCEGLILGGARVHDWFHAHAAVDAATLTVEPLRFGDGLPIFSDQTERCPVEAFLRRGLVIVEESRLNAAGTRLLRLERR